jgi:hypothetical protein
MLDLAGLATLVDEWVDTYAVRERAVAFTHSPHGLAAARAAGIAVEPSPLANLLDPRIAR